VSLMEDWRREGVAAVQETGRGGELEGDGGVDEEGQQSSHGRFVSL
jgi:hypothetical protein